MGQDVEAREDGREDVPRKIRTLRLWDFENQGMQQVDSADLPPLNAAEEDSFM